MKSKHTECSRTKRRLKRLRKTRLKIDQLSIHCLSVFRSDKHIYAQLISPDRQVVTASSTLSKTFRDSPSNSKLSNLEKAAWVGQDIAKKAKTKNITQVAFDRSGYKYHGRIKCLADSAREAGLKF